MLLLIKKKLWQCLKGCWEDKLTNEKLLMGNGIKDIWNLFFVFLNKGFSKELICVFN